MNEPLKPTTAEERNMAELAVDARGVGIDAEVVDIVERMAADIDRLTADLAAVRMERDALKAGTHAGGWRRVEPVVGNIRDRWRRWPTTPNPDLAASCAGVFPEGELGYRWMTYGPSGTDGTAPTAEAARKAADEALRAAGWWLEPGEEGKQ